MRRKFKAPVIAQGIWTGIQEFIPPPQTTVAEFIGYAQAALRAHGTALSESDFQAFAYRQGHWLSKDEILDNLPLEDDTVVLVSTSQIRILGNSIDLFRTIADQILRQWTRPEDEIRMPQIIIEQGEIIMKKEETRISEVSISGVSGQVFLGRLNDVIANLNSVGRNELAEALKAAQESVVASQDLSDEQKREQIEVINQIGEEAAKAKPNRTLLKSFGDGLMNTVKAIPDVAKAVAAITEILSKFYL